MPITDYWEENGILSLWQGAVTVEDIHNSNYQAMEDPRALTLKYHIVNTLQAETIEMDDMLMVDIAADDASFSRKVNNLKVALIVNKPKFRQLAEKYIHISWKLNSSWHFRIFESEKEAREWLHLDMHQNLV